MTAYIIAYSIIMFLLLIVTVVLCVIFVKNQQRKSEKLIAQRPLWYSALDGCDENSGNGGVAFMLVDAKTGEPVFISSNIKQYLGVTSKELTADVSAYKRALGKKTVREFERAFAEWDGDGVFTYEFCHDEDKFAKSSIFKATNGDKQYYAIAFYDVTEDRNKQKSMQQQLDGALEQAAAKSTYLSSMSHEIRTPMNGIMGMMSLARMNINDPVKVGNYLERAGDLSVFLLGMINDILDISKIESGKMQLFNTDLDIFAFAEKIRNMFNGTITGKGIDFSVETTDISARHLIADELRLTQVVTNLVSNASKFTPAGGKITVTFKQLDHIGGNVQLMVRVRDTGKGIAPENIRKIFRPFEQEEASTAHRFGGTGLGLAICDNIVRLMGGNIVIDSTLGKGSDFSVFLSLPVSDKDQDLSEPIAAETSAPAVANDFTFDGCRILLAEDNEINAEIAVEILESEGAIVTLAHDGQEALDIFTDKPVDTFDLLLLDIQMPRLDGRSAAKAIRKCAKADASSVPIIALSADAFVEDVKLSEAAGMDGHVSKPIDFDELRVRSGEIIAAKKGMFGETAEAKDKPSQDEKAGKAPRKKGAGKGVNKSKNELNGGRKPSIRKEVSK